MRERTLFMSALDITNPAERAAYLDRACADDARLRAGVEALLKAHEADGSFMQARHAALAPTMDGPLAERPGTVIGPYKLMEQIGEGGMGLVFVAEQQQPVRRKVALKIIKPGMDTRQVIARFEAERQALALMEHQNIARVLDAGTTASGRPYFVMELVHGVPIIEYCDANQLSPRQRLELFIPICHAIQHAHQKGIIHRDIKPSNVLVTMYDDKPVPKVIDFGVAKAIEQRLTDKTVYTQFGTFVGTFEYMSPEQAEMNAFGVDTRSDIYSLGVLLYELLTGTTPLERAKLREAAFAEIVRLIKEEEPQRPSARLSTSGVLAKVAAARKTDPAKLPQLLRGELDWVVMRCLEKDRTRRYETANGLARDLERYLRDEPVEACPPSTRYRLHKFLRKHRAGVLTGGAFLTLLLASVAASTYLAVRATQAEAVALEERDQKEIALQEADEARQKAVDFANRLRESIALFGRAQLDVQQGRWAAAYAAFKRAQECHSDLLQIYVFRTWMYQGLGLWDRAAEDGAEVLKRTGGTVWFHWHWHRHALLCLHLEDEAGYRDTCQRMIKRFGDGVEGGWENLVRACVLSPRPAMAPEELVRMAERVVTDEKFHWHLYVAGLAHYRAGHYKQAVERLRESIAIDPNWNARDINYPVLAMAYQRLGEADQAQQALASAEKAIDRWTAAMLQGPVGTMPIPWIDWLECLYCYREAKILLTGSAPAADPRLRTIRARALAALSSNDAGKPRISANSAGAGRGGEAGRKGANE